MKMGVSRQLKLHKQRTENKLECKFKKNLKDTSVCVTHCGVSQLRTMNPLASLSLVSSWDRELRLSTSHSLPPLAKILPCFNHHTGSGVRELSHYRYIEHTQTYSSCMRGG